MKKRTLDNYVYIRLMDGDKERVKDKAASEGMDMTTWIRNLVLKALKK